jgi:hypothetical protein
MAIVKRHSTLQGVEGLLDEGIQVERLLVHAFGTDLLLEQPSASCSYISFV